MKNHIRLKNLQRIIDEKFKSWRALSLAIDKLPSYMNEIKHGKRDFTTNLVEYIENKLLLKSGTLDYDADNLEQEPILLKVEERDFVIDNTLANYYINQKHILDLKLDINNLKIFTMQDSSMHPIVTKDSKVLINTIKKDLNNNALALVKFNNKIMLRKIFIIKPEEELLLKCINVDYPDESAPFAKLEIVGYASALIWQPLTY